MERYFIHGFKWNAKDMKMKSNFDIMMRHFHGNDIDTLSKIVIEKMRAHVERDEYLGSFKAHRLEWFQQKVKAAIVLQQWWLKRRIA